MKLCRLTHTHEPRQASANIFVNAQMLTMCSLLTLHFHYLTFSLSHTSTNTYICKHVAQLPTVIWEETSRFQAHENLCFWMIRGEADGSISEAAAARPTAPSGAENQDNFIVIISLPLSLLLQPRRRRKGNTREGECEINIYIYIYI